MKYLLFIITLVAFMVFGCGSDDGSNGQINMPDGDADVSDGDVSNSDGDEDSIDGDSVEPDGDNDVTEDDLLENEEEPYVFNEFAWQTLPEDVVDTRMCAEAADPANAPDPIYIDCVVEGESYVESLYPAKDELLVMAYNMERGYHVDEMIDAFLNNPEVPNPDVILVSEADRGCSRTDRRYVLRDIARAMGMYYIYAVEFIELPRGGGSGGSISEMCEHGNGILSRYPLGNVEAIRHAVNRDWSTDEGEPRLGGRIAVTADVLVGESVIGLAAIHFESNANDDYRGPQAQEMVTHARSKPFPVVIGGDFNCGLYSLDLSFGTNNDQTIRPFLEAGFFDAHGDWPIEERVTHPGNGFLLDLLLSSADVFSDPGMCPEEKCGNLSDHLPVWATVALP